MITRPNGRPYRPRKSGLRAHAWENDDESGLIVFGTLDPAAAEAFALDASTYWYGSGGAVVDPESGWFRDCFRRGERRWERDELRGTPGVKFTWVQTDDICPPAPEQAEHLRRVGDDSLSDPESTEETE